MSKNNINGSRSVSSNSFNSFLSDGDIIESGLDDLSIGSKTLRPSSTSKAQKAKRIRFYHNGNKYFSGIVIPVTSERYRSFDSLTSELTKILTKSVTLPSGVRTVYTLDGKKVCSIDDLEDGKDYVVCGNAELFKKIEYTKTETPKSKRLCHTKYTITNSVPKIIVPDCVRPRIVTLIKNSIKPRKILRILLNKRNASSMEQVLSAFSEVAQLAINKVYNQNGQAVTDLPQLFNNDDIFFLYGNERPSQSDFELEFEESKTIQQYKRTPGLRRNGEPKPKMPKKELNRTYESEESLLKRLSEDNHIFLPPPLKNKYEVGRTIGDGNFAVVRLCRDTTTNIEYALKIIDKAKCKGKEDMIDNEVKTLSNISHPNIMALIEEQDSKHMLYLVCEYVRGGDLFDIIAAVQKFSEDQAALMISHLASALAYLHSKNIVHRDVKPENLLVELENSRVKLLKLGDFGLACEVTKPLYTVCGTPTYVAPEILAETGYGLKVDVWAAGVIMYILLCGYPPFVSLNNDQEKLFDCILSGQYDFPDEYWSDVSLLAKELISNMLQLAPELRFSAEDVLDHPWLHNAN